MFCCAAVTKCINIILSSFCDYMSLLCTLQHDQFVLTDFNGIWCCGALDNCVNVIKCCSLLVIDWHAFSSSIIYLYTKNGLINVYHQSYIPVSVYMKTKTISRVESLFLIQEIKLNYSNIIYSVKTWISHFPFRALSFTYYNLNQQTHTIVLDLPWFLYYYCISNTPMCSWFKL
jgi:hypothetical protein